MGAAWPTCMFNLMGHCPNLPSHGGHAHTFRILLQWRRQNTTLYARHSAGPCLPKPIDSAHREGTGSGMPRCVGAIVRKLWIQSNRCPATHNVLAA
ncbi:hypothetical protein VFPBJ_11407 [Purpureocillium lilacinum]|uniref:Uncharacterized protein n=1 Tax=Purpureocillium lilacinum TaxID=33203 RepID=A0A179FAS0_PURLI|nr:hypothetical protein VFPBJ_11407 [Purpureocillium lilacinum]